MAYCRWSCMNGYCDVYVYEDVNGGWTTHVAVMRRPPGAPPDPMEALKNWANLEDKNAAIREYKKRLEAWRVWAGAVESEINSHPEAGKSFNHSTPGECADNLERLRGEGFVVPQSAVHELRREQEALESQP